VVFQAEPSLDQESRVTDPNALLTSDEINDASPGLAIAKTDPALSQQIHPELFRVVTLMQRTGTVQSIAAPPQSLRQSVVNQYVAHGHGSLENIESNESGVHRYKKKGEPKLSLFGR